MAAIRSSQSGDEIVIINFDLIKPDDTDPNVPLIESLQPAEVEQGRLKNLQLVVTGQRFGDAASVIDSGQPDVADDGLKRSHSAYCTTRACSAYRSSYPAATSPTS